MTLWTAAEAVAATGGTGTEEQQQADQRHERHSTALIHDRGIWPLETPLGDGDSPLWGPKCVYLVTTATQYSVLFNKAAGSLMNSSLKPTPNIILSRSYCFRKKSIIISKKII